MCKYCEEGKKHDCADVDIDSQIKWWIYKDNLITKAIIKENEFSCSYKINFCPHCSRDLQKGES